MRSYFLILALLISGNCMAELYKWTSPNGEVHYSDQPPPKQKELEVTKLRSSSRPAPPPAVIDNATEKQQIQAEQQQQAAAEHKAIEEERARINAQNCETAQQNYRNLQSGSRIMEVNAQGERTYLDEQQIQQKLQQAQQSINKYCQ